MPTTDLLKTFGLSRNPFTDRTAEKTSLDTVSLYIHSDLRGFKPNETTYVFFGKRGSGKTTIRLQMEEAYRQHNAAAAAAGHNKGFFMVDMARPGHLTACLKTFQETIGASEDNWDAAFQDAWTSADVVDCMLAYSATALVQMLTRQGEQQRAMIEALRGDGKACKQLLLLLHLYARADSGALAYIRRALNSGGYSATQVAAAAGITAAAAGTAVAAAKQPELAAALAAPLEAAWEQAEDMVPALRNHPKLLLAAAAAAAAGGAAYYMRWSRRRSLERAAALQRQIRVVKPQPVADVAALVDSLFAPSDSVDTLRLLCIGISAHQKLEALKGLLQLLGWESLTVFGDCFDEVTLLDPVRFPGAVKVMAREICRNDMLNFGRLHFFFPDSRLALDLSTDKTLKEARFDRHFVRDLTWSRHQLEELAERRFRAAQQALRDESQGGGDGGFDGGSAPTSFADLFKKVRGEDFSSYIAKLATPRELLIMMTEMFARMEAHPEGGLTAQDMEIAVAKAQEQAV